MNKQPDRQGASRTIATARALYFLPRENLAEEVLIPGFSEAKSARCMVGFFSSTVLRDLAPGLATFLNKGLSPLQLIFSPYLSKEDQAALAAGVQTPEQIAETTAGQLFVSVNDLERHTLRCLSHLIGAGRISIQIAIMKNALFHPKVWLFEVEEGQVAVHGSSNMTHAAISKNKEQITVSKSWVDPTQRYIVEKLNGEFDSLWRRTDEDCWIVDLPEAIQKKLMRELRPEHPPTEQDFLDLQKTREAEEPSLPPLQTMEQKLFRIPAWLRYDEGDFAHQGVAIRAWEAAGCRGTLEMATGSGKTLTAMIATYRLYEKHSPLLVIIAAPYLPLIEQWCDEVRLFDLEPINLSEFNSASDRSKELQRLRRKIRLGMSKVEVCVVSHDTLCTDQFQQDIKSFECKTLLIADEAHNLGRPAFVRNPPDFFEYRMALSATPIRQYDEEGTDAIFAFFGPPVFQFTLKQAIGKCLVEYDYNILQIGLTAVEMDSWADLTAQIRQNAWRQSEGKPDEMLASLFRKRRLLLETAAGKIDALFQQLSKMPPNSIRHTLIYCTDKDPAQLEQVNALLMEKGILFHQLTSSETVNRKKSSEIIAAFQGGDIQVLTAKRVLDEGVNIPQIREAHILASNTLERQWVQRRGRLLRTCNAIGKTHGVIYDYVALPSNLNAKLDPDARSLVKSELKRAQEFVALARNAARPDGPIHVVHRMVEAASNAIGDRDAAE